MLAALPAALDGVGEHRARVVMRGQARSGSGLEQQDGLASDRVGLEVPDEHLTAVRREWHQGIDSSLITEVRIRS